MPQTKRERREVWKRRTTKTAEALRGAGATVTRSGERSIPISARKASQIRVAAWRAKHPIRTVVDVAGKHTRIDSRLKDLSHREQARYNMLYSTYAHGVELTQRHQQELYNMQQKLIKRTRQTASQRKADQQRKDFQATDGRLYEDKDKYIRTVTQDISPPWYIKLPQNTSKSNMVNAIKKGYPTANTTGLTDYQIVVLYENVRAGLHTTKPTASTPDALDIKLSQEVLDFEKWMRDKAKDIRGLVVPFGEEGPVKHPQESIARMAELIGGVPASIETVIHAPKRIPEFAAAGAYGMTVGTVEAFKDDPIQTTSDIVLTVGLFHAAGKVRGKISSTVTSARRGEIQPSAIIEETVLTGERKFPVTQKPGVTADAAINEFIKSEKNIRTAIDTGKVDPPITSKITGTSQKFLDDVKKIDGEMSAWHAAQKGIPKKTAAQVGTSSTPGLHVAPSLSPHFLGIGGETAVFGFRKGGKPTAISIEVVDFQRIPRTSRSTSKQMNKFLSECNEEVGPQGIAYITTKFEQLSGKSSVEFEAVLPPGAPLVRVGKTLEMTWEGKKISVEQYKTVFTESVKTDIKNITTLEKLYSERAGKKVIISPYDVLKASAVSRSSTTKSYNQYSSVFSLSITSSISSISSAISSIRPSYISRPVSSVVSKTTSFASYSSKYSSYAGSYIRGIESYIQAVPTIPVRPPIVPVISRPAKKTKTKKKKKKTPEEIRAYRVRNPIPTLASFLR